MEQGQRRREAARRARVDAAGAVGHRQRRADPRPRPHAEARRQDLRARPREVPGAGSRSSRATSAFADRSLVLAFEGVGRRRQGRRDPARHRRARRAPVRDRARSPRRPTRSARIPTCGDSGGRCRRAAASRSSTARGTAACWSSASRAICARRRLDARLRRDQPVRGAARRRRRRRRASSGCRSARPSSCARFRAREKTAVQALQDHAATTGATARSGTPTSRRSRDMVDRTRTEIAPWTLVEAEDKRYARRQDPEDDRASSSSARWTDADDADRPTAPARLAAPLRRARVAARRPRADDLSGTCCRAPSSRTGASASTRPTATSGTSTGSTPRGARRRRAARRAVPRPRRQLAARTTRAR